MSVLPPVAVICPNLSSNALGRALLLAELVASHTSVRVLGVRRGDAIWAPARNSPIRIEEFALSREARYSPAPARWLRSKLHHDLVLVSKPVPHSLGLALAAGVRPRQMVVDIDDWESGFFQGAANESSSHARFLWARFRSYGRRFGMNSFVLTRALEEIARRVPHRIVSNRWLQQRFGGELLYHVRDADTLHPQPATAPAAERPWVAFVGTPRTHKGLEVLLEAMELQRGQNAAGLLLMGAPASHPLLDRARARLGEHRFSCMPEFPLAELPARLARADIIAIPSLDVPAAWGQIPAKLFDALAMGKPVVVSDVNDMREIVEGCGIAVPAGDARALAGAIARLAASPELRADLGAAARARFLERFTYTQGREIISRVLHAAAQR
jgi:glycosyltransferase involved in cell wall biosynthesis